MPFTWNNSTLDLPKLSDIIDPSEGVPFNMLQLFTYAWTWFLGSWFFALIIGIIGGSLYVRSNNAVYTSVYFVLMAALFTTVLNASPIGDLPSTAIFMDIIGIFVAFAFGFLIYGLYRKSK